MIVLYGPSNSEFEGFAITIELLYINSPTKFSVSPWSRKTLRRRVSIILSICLFLPNYLSCTQTQGKTDTETQRHIQRYGDAETHTYEHEHTLTLTHTDNNDCSIIKAHYCTLHPMDEPTNQHKLLIDLHVCNIQKHSSSNPIHSAFWAAAPKG